MDTTAARRRLTIADAMILVAACGPGFVLGRWLMREANFRILATSQFATLARTAALAVGILSPCAASWTLALLGLRLLPPRPARRRLARQPGGAALSVGSLILLVGGGFVYAVDRLSGLLPRAWPLVETLLLWPLLVGSGVGASWLTLRMASRWPRPADWIDRAGRLLGWYWIAAGPLCFWILNG